MLLATINALGCGGESASPDLLAGSFRILAGANVTDTISTTPTQGLVIEVLNARGDPDPGVEVRFEAPSPSRMSVSGGNQSGFAAVASAITDASGRATIRYQFTTRAGDGWIAVFVPLYNLNDTARFTILPGAAVRVAFTPKDTAVAPGASFSYQASAVDRASNPRVEQVTFEATGTAVRVTPGGVVTTQSLGISRVRARAPVGSTVVVDSGTVAVVPDAQIVWSNNFGTLTLGELNGSSSRTLVVPGQVASWEPGGQRVVYAFGGLMFLNVNGGGDPLPTPGFNASNWPEWSADGQWIYFHGDAVDGRRIARIHPDRSGIETLSPGDGVMPTPAPDGQSVAYIANGSVVVLDLTTRNARTLPGTAGSQSPRWSPNGHWIAH